MPTAADHAPGVACLTLSPVIPKLSCRLGTTIREVTWEQLSFILVTWELEGICEREKHPKQVKWAATSSCHV